METAFREKEFERVVAYAEKACRLLPAEDEALPLIGWWLEAKSPGEVEPS
jgi:hypothetical protein